jgi:hypothetical protein
VGKRGFDHGGANPQQPNKRLNFFYSRQKCRQRIRFLHQLDLLLDHSIIFVVRLHFPYVRWSEPVHKRNPCVMPGILTLEDSYSFSQVIYNFISATLAMHLVSLIMTFIMISNVRFKYTAVGISLFNSGRKEIQVFFYLYATSIVSEILVISGIVPFSSTAYPFFVAFHSSIVLSTLWCLFFNGFVPFQFIEDGTAMSMWVLYT